jgi:hypothetical protein
MKPPLSQFKAPRAVLIQQHAKREAVHGFAVVRRCQRIHAIVQTRLQGSLCSSHSNRSEPLVDS